jgi:hypothetical protein
MQFDDAYDDYLTLTEIYGALDATYAATGKIFDFTFSDDCLMADLDAFSVFSSFSKYYIASQISIEYSTDETIPGNVGTLN